MTTVGIIGAGHIGSTLARGLVARGYDVVIANSRGPETLTDLVADLGAKARAATATEAAEAADWAIVTVPLKALDGVPVEPLAGKIVLDTCNYYPSRDGNIAAIDEKRSTSAQLVQEHLPDSRVAKAFNHIVWTDILAQPADADPRRALATTSDHEDAAALVAAVYDEFGFDTVNVGRLTEGWRIELDQALVQPRTADQLREYTAAAIR